MRSSTCARSETSTVYCAYTLVQPGASVGVANWPGDGGSARRLFDTADRALYAAKAAGRPDMSPVESIGIAS